MHMGFLPSYAIDRPISPSFGRLVAVVVVFITVAAAASSQDFSVGSRHACVVAADMARCWGKNDNGQLGKNDRIYYGDDEIVSGKTILRVGTFDKVESVSAGGLHTCVIISTGDVHCFGWNINNQLGLAPTADVLKPAAKVDLPDKAIYVSAGHWHSCAITETHQVYCWGVATDGALGTDSATYTVGTNVAVDLPLGEVSQVSAGGRTTCVLHSNETLVDNVVCWGNNDNGKLGRDSTTHLGGGNDAMSTASPIPFGKRATKVVTAWTHTCALFVDGAIRCVGASDGLGYDGVGGDVGSGGSSLAAAAAPDVGLPLPAVDVCVGMQMSCAVLNNGTVWCWGLGDFGKIGSGDGNVDLGTSASFPLSSGQALPLNGGDAKQVDCLYHNVCVRYENDKVSCWGENQGGIVGAGHVFYTGDQANEISSLPLLDVFELPPSLNDSGWTSLGIKDRLCLSNLQCGGDAPSCDESNHGVVAQDRRSLDTCVAKQCDSGTQFSLETYECVADEVLEMEAAGWTYLGYENRLCNSELDCSGGVPICDNSTNLHVVSQDRRFNGNGCVAQDCAGGVQQTHSTYACIDKGFLEKGWDFVGYLDRSCSSELDCSGGVPECGPGTWDTYAQDRRWSNGCVAQGCDSGSQILTATFRCPTASPTQAPSYSPTYVVDVYRDYDFDSSTLTDKSGNDAVSGAITGAVTFAEGHDGAPNSALSFSGTSHVQFDEVMPMYYPENDWKLSFWVKYDPNLAHCALLWGRENTADVNRMQIYVQPTGGSPGSSDVGLDYRTPSGVLRTIMSAKFFQNDGGWHKIAITKTFETWKIYLDDVLTETTVDSNQDLPNAASWRLSGRSGFDFAGQIDDVKMEITSSTSFPTNAPSDSPTRSPSDSPTTSPSFSPTSPSVSPTFSPTITLDDVNGGVIELLDYDNYEKKLWRIVAPDSDYAVRLNFTLFDIEGYDCGGCCDSFRLYGFSPQDKYASTLFCGTLIPLHVPMVSARHEIEISFDSDYSVNGPGFSLQYDFVHESEVPVHVIEIDPNDDAEDVQVSLPDLFAAHDVSYPPRSESDALWKYSWVKVKLQAPVGHYVRAADGMSVSQVGPIDDFYGYNEDEKTCLGEAVRWLTYAGTLIFATNGVEETWLCGDANDPRRVSSAYNSLIIGVYLSHTVDFDNLNGIITLRNVSAIAYNETHANGEEFAQTFYKATLTEENAYHVVDLRGKAPDPGTNYVVHVDTDDHQKSHVVGIIGFMDVKRFQNASSAEYRPVVCTDALLMSWSAQVFDDPFKGAFVADKRCGYTPGTTAPFRIPPPKRVYKDPYKSGLTALLHNSYDENVGEGVVLIFRRVESTSGACLAEHRAVDDKNDHYKVALQYDEVVDDITGATVGKSYGMRSYVGDRFEDLPRTFQTTLYGNAGFDSYKGRKICGRGRVVRVTDLRDTEFTENVDFAGLLENVFADQVTCRLDQTERPAAFRYAGDRFILSANVSRNSSYEFCALPGREYNFYVSRYGDDEVKEYAFDIDESSGQVCHLEAEERAEESRVITDGSFEFYSSAKSILNRDATLGYRPEQGQAPVEYAVCGGPYNEVFDTFSKLFFCPPGVKAKDGEVFAAFHTRLDFFDFKVKYLYQSIYLRRAPSPEKPILKFYVGGKLTADDRIQIVARSLYDGVKKAFYYDEHVAASVGIADLEFFSPDCVDWTLVRIDLTPMLDWFAEDPGFRYGKLANVAVRFRTPSVFSIDSWIWLDDFDYEGPAVADPSKYEFTNPPELDPVGESAVLNAEKSALATASSAMLGVTSFILASSLGVVVMRKRSLHSTSVVQKSTKLFGLALSAWAFIAVAVSAINFLALNEFKNDLDSLSVQQASNAVEYVQRVNNFTWASETKVKFYIPPGSKDAWFDSFRRWDDASPTEDAPLCSFTDECASVEDFTFSDRASFHFQFVPLVTADRIIALVSTSIIFDVAAALALLILYLDPPIVAVVDEKFPLLKIRKWDVLLTVLSAVFALVAISVALASPVGYDVLTTVDEISPRPAQSENEIEDIITRITSARLKSSAIDISSSGDLTWDLDLGGAYEWCAPTGEDFLIDDVMVEGVSAPQASFQACDGETYQVDAEARCRSLVCDSETNDGPLLVGSAELLEPWVDYIVSFARGSVALTVLVTIVNLISLYAAYSLSDEQHVDAALVVDAAEKVDPA